MLLNLLLINWILTILVLIGTLANAKQKIWGFYIWIFTNMSYVLVDVWCYNNHARAFLFLVQTAMCILGIIEWRKKAKNTIELK